MELLMYKLSMTKLLIAISLIALFACDKKKAPDASLLMKHIASDTHGAETKSIDYTVLSF